MPRTIPATAIPLDIDFKPIAPSIIAIIPHGIERYMKQQKITDTIPRIREVIAIGFLESAVGG